MRLISIKQTIIKKESKYTSKIISDKYGLSLKVAEKLCLDIKQENKFIETKKFSKCFQCFDSSIVQDRCEHCKNFLDTEIITVVYYNNNNRGNDEKIKKK